MKCNMTKEIANRALKALIETLELKYDVKIDYKLVKKEA